VHFDAVFPLLASAAHTQDPRVWPILRQGLRADQHTTAFVPGTSLRLAWPTVLDFMFAPFGPGLCAQLATEAERVGADAPPAQARSLTFLFGRNLCLEGLPLLRRWADAGEALGAEAVRALGRLGHPEDEARLQRAAASHDPELRRSAAYALYDLGDEAAAPTLRRLLHDQQEPVRMAAMAGLFHLIDPAGAAALVDHAAKLGPAAGKEREHYDKLLDAFAEASFSDPADLRKGDRTAWRAAIGRYHMMKETLYLPRTGDRRLSHQELERAFDEWEREGRLGGGTFAWVEPRHLLGAATPADLPRMLAVRGALCGHPSEEALAELDVWDRMLSLVHRRRLPGKAQKI